MDSLSTQKVWLGYTLKECREMEISLGLDLKGGMNVVLELNVADVIRSLSNNNQDENFNKALVWLMKIRLQVKRTLLIYLQKSIRS